MKTRGLLLVALAALAALAGFWAGRELAGRRAAKTAEREARECATQLGAVRRQAVSWADAVAKGQGEAVLRAFVAGVAPALRVERQESLETAAISLLRVPGVAGIHVLRPEGKVLYSSDAKLTTTGEIGEGGKWALAASKFESRVAAREGVIEFVVPLVDAGRVLAVIWMEFAQGAVRDAARPTALATLGNPAAAAKTAENAGGVDPQGGPPPVSAAEKPVD